MSIMVAAFNRLLTADDGQDLIEYGVLVALIVLAAVVSVSLLGDTITAVFWEPIAQNF